jgi:hypothetical protein
MDAVFPVRSVPRLYKGSENRVEARSNASTLILRIVGGDEKGTQCLGIYVGVLTILLLFIFLFSYLQCNENNFFLVGLKKFEPTIATFERRQFML